MSRQINKGQIVQVKENTSGHNFIQNSMAECTNPLFYKEQIAEFIGLDADGGIGVYYMNDEDYKIVKHDRNG